MSRGARARGAAVLVAAVVVLAARLFRARLWMDFLDETAEIASGWVVSEGGTFYGTVFSHHMPLPVVAGHVVAAISPTDRIEHFRVVPFLGYLLAALAIARSPLLKGRPGAGNVAAAIFLASTAVAAPNLWGHMLLADPLWGCAFVSALVLLVLPILTGIAPTRAGAAASGACFVLAIAGSLIAALPLALAGVLLAASAADPARRRLAIGAARPCFAGAGVAFLLLAVWLSCFGEPANFYEEAVRFNTQVYSFFAYGGTPILLTAVDSWRTWLRSAPRDLARGDMEVLFLVVFLVACFVLAKSTWKRRSPVTRGSRALVTAEIVTACVLLASLRSRGGGFHALPFVLGLFALLAILGALAQRRLIAAGVALVLVVPVAVLSLKDRAAWSSPSVNAEEAGTFGAVARYVRAHSREDETFAVFPFPPSLYVRARRRPATNSVYFFPWQRSWESVHPETPDTCTQLRRSAPHFVFLWPVLLWERYPWGEPEWGACIDRYVKENYTPVRPQEFEGLLWERRDPSPGS